MKTTENIQKKQSLRAFQREFQKAFEVDFFVFAEVIERRNDLNKLHLNSLGIFRAFQERDGKREKRERDL